MNQQQKRQPNVENDSVTTGLSRRALLSGASAAVAAMALPGALRAQESKDKPKAKRKPYKATGENINQSVCHWCFKPMKLERLAAAAADMGVKSVELVGPEQWPILKKHGLTCAITPSHGFPTGFANTEQHAECIEKLTKAIDATSAAGFPTVITFSGFANGTTKEEGLKNAVAGLKKIIGYAEKKKVNLCLEMLNTRVDVEMKGHPGYLADEVEWVIDVCKQVGSPRMKLLFDIYHVQIMQGDVITRINQFHEYIGHYHTAGVPGRNELDEDQELNFRGIMKAIVKTGYKGYVGQEFIPTSKNKLGSLRKAVRICDV